MVEDTHFVRAGTVLAKLDQNDYEPAVDKLQAAQAVPEQIASAQANVQRVGGELRRTKATLKDALLDLGYTEIIAPVDGVIGRRQIEVGQRVSAGQLILTLTPPSEIWAIANFKETQLRRMRTGQTATIHVDAFGEDLSGVVESFGAATGSKYAVLPPENATGNFVKIVQRVPVRIRLSLPSDPRALLPGMSVEVEVDTRR